MTNVEALKNLYTALGGNAADVADAVTNVDVLNAIAGFLGGEVDANLISDAINNISAVAPTGGGAELDELITRSISTVKSDVYFIGAGAFMNCISLFIADFSKATQVSEKSFEYCTSLRTLILRGNAVAQLAATAFGNSAIARGTGYIYVPDELVDSYKTATNWSTYANQIKGISELPAE